MTIDKHYCSICLSINADILHESVNESSSGPIITIMMFYTIANISPDAILEL